MGGATKPPFFFFLTELATKVNLDKTETKHYFLFREAFFLTSNIVKLLYPLVFISFKVGKGPLANVCSRLNKKRHNISHVGAFPNNPLTVKDLCQMQYAKNTRCTASGPVLQTSMTFWLL